MKLSTLSAMVLAFTLSGAAFAADDPQSPTGQAGAQQQQQNQPGTSQSGQDGSSQKERDYQAELKKCDIAPDQQKCLDAVKKKFAEM